MNLLEAPSHQDEGLHQLRSGDLKSRLGGRLRLVTDDSKEWNAPWERSKDKNQISRQINTDTNL